MLLTKAVFYVIDLKNGPYYSMLTLIWQPCKHFMD